MSLPRKRKRLPENQIPEEINQAVRTGKRSSENAGSTVTARTRQMQKAFEIVNHIEQVHDNLDRVEPAASVQSPAPGESSNPEELRMRVSLGNVPADEQDNERNSEGSAAPLIEVKLTIPTFLWKVPFLGGAARSLIRRLSKVET